MIGAVRIMSWSPSLNQQRLVRGMRMGQAVLQGKQPQYTRTEFRRGLLELPKHALATTVETKFSALTSALSDGDARWLAAAEGAALGPDNVAYGNRSRLFAIRCAWGGFTRPQNASTKHHAATSRTSSRKEPVAVSTRMVPDHSIGLHPLRMVTAPDQLEALEGIRTYLSGLLEAYAPVYPFRPRIPKTAEFVHRQTDLRSILDLLQSDMQVGLSALAEAFPYAGAVNFSLLTLASTHMDQLGEALYCSLYQAVVILGMDRVCLLNSKLSMTLMCAELHALSRRPYLREQRFPSTLYVVQQVFHRLCCMEKHEREDAWLKATLILRTAGECINLQDSGLCYWPEGAFKFFSGDEWATHIVDQLTANGIVR